MTRGCQRLCVRLRRSSIAGREQNLLTTLVIAKHLHRIIYSSFDQVRAYLLVHSARKIHTPGGNGDRFSTSLKYSGAVGSASVCRSYRLDKSKWIIRGVSRLVTVLVVDEDALTIRPRGQDDLMYRSNRSFNMPPPGIPRAFDTFAVPGRRKFDYQSLPGGGEFDPHALGVGNLNCTLDFM